MFYDCSWREEKHHFFQWSKATRITLKLAYIQLLKHAKTYLHQSCTHLKGHGGVKGALKCLEKKIHASSFFARFDIQAYYTSINHKVLFEILKKQETPLWMKILLSVYVRVAGKIGIPAGSSLSPLIGAIYLHPLDDLMKRQKIAYIRYMDDYVLLSKKRWPLKKAIKSMHQVLDQLNLEIHPDKQQIGRVEKGIHFLGYTIDPIKKLTPSTQGLLRYHACFRRLYEQGASFRALWQYTNRWWSWYIGGLDDLVSTKGGPRQLFIRALKQNKIQNQSIPNWNTGFT